MLIHSTRRKRRTNNGRRRPIPHHDKLTGYRHSCRRHHFTPHARGYVGKLILGARRKKKKQEVEADVIISRHAIPKSNDLKTIQNSNVGKELHQTDAKEQSKQARVGRTKKGAGNSSVETDKLERTIWTKRKHRMTFFVTTCFLLVSCEEPRFFTSYPVTI